MSEVEQVRPDAVVASRPETEREGQAPDIGAVDQRPGLLALLPPHDSTIPLRARAIRQLSQQHGNQFVQRALGMKQHMLRSAVEPSRIDRQESVERSTITPTASPEAAIQRDGSTTTVTINITEALGGTYNVTATTLAGAAAQMSARGEWGRGGVRNLGYTTGTVNDDGIVSSVTITGAYFRTLPNWTQKSSQSSAVQGEWDRMLTALTGHENHHVSIARTHIEELRGELSSIREGDLASTWNAKVGPTGALQTAQNDYDTSTTSGQSEGVSLTEPTEEGEAAGEAESAPLGGEE